MHSTLPLLEETRFPRICRGPLETLQVNLGYLCNLSCVHCHVNAGPKRTEIMARETIDDVIDFVLREKVARVDLTGGAPEMNPHFKNLVRRLRAYEVQVIDRCNLTVLEESGYEDIAGFLAEQGVEIVASLPCYLEENVERQRGKGVFCTSIQALKKLNRLGYGDPDTGLELNLVFNPQGAVLPPPQDTLEEAYKQHLKNEFGIVFNRLYTLTNMPIQRFGSTLISKGEFEPYMKLLRSSFRAENLDSVMCRSTLSIDWRGFVYDCDFNQMLELPLGNHGQTKIHIREIVASDLDGSPIRIADHCYGCTAGQGSSCGGALENANIDSAEGTNK